MDIPRHPLTGCGQIPPLLSSNTLLPYLSASPLLALPRLITPPPPLLTTLINGRIQTSSQRKPALCSSIIGHSSPHLLKSFIRRTHPKLINFGTWASFNDFASLIIDLPADHFHQRLPQDIIPKKTSTVFQIYFFWLPSDCVYLMSDRFPPSHLCRSLSPTSLIENQSIAVTKTVYLPVFLIMSSSFGIYVCLTIYRDMHSHHQMEEPAKENQSFHLL